jgi:L-rhamnose isomerase/sugar isomerase
MVQTVMAAQELFAKALLVDLDALDTARAANDIVAAEECLKRAFATDVRELLASWRDARGLPRDPLTAHRASGYAARAAALRLPRKTAHGGSYA